MQNDKQKLVIFLAAASGSGKSTTSKAFAVGEPEQHQKMMSVDTRIGKQDKKISWTLYDNYALAGTHNAGSDANNGPGAIRESFYICMNLRDIVVVDGMMSSPQWAEMVRDWNLENKDYKLGILIVHFDIDSEEVLRRLAGRRGVSKESIREKMMPKCIANVKRPIHLMGHIDNICDNIPTTTLKIYKDDDTAKIVELMDEQVADWFETEWKIC